MGKRIIVFGMDGNVLDNYPIKMACAGEAMAENAQKTLGTRKDPAFFSNIYAETGGMNALKQFSIAYARIAPPKKVTQALLERTERDFRKKLDASEQKIRMFRDVEAFLEKHKNEYIFAITTTVPIEKIPKRARLTGMDRYFTLICARGGAWREGKITKIAGFDKGKAHYAYLLKELKGKKEEMAAISSSKEDIIHAKKYGITSIALEHLFDRETLAHLEPDEILEKCTDAQKALQTR